MAFTPKPRLIELEMVPAGNLRLLSGDLTLHAQVKGEPGRYPRQREYPQPPPPSRNRTTRTINKVSRDTFRRFEALPDTTVVHPGHDYVGRPVTTIGEEKARNQLFRERDRAALMSRLSVQAPPPANMAAILRHNIGEADAARIAPAEAEPRSVPIPKNGSVSVATWPSWNAVICRERKQPTSASAMIGARCGQMEGL